MNARRRLVATSAGLRCRRSAPAWFAGPRGQAARLRRLVVDGAAASRQAAEARGVTTGRIGEWIGAYARTIRVIIAVLTAAVILLLRPLSFSDVVWVAVIAVVALLLVLFLGRPRAEGHARSA